VRQIAELCLYDIKLVHLKPTWMNMHYGDVRIAKRLNYFLVSDDFVAISIRIRKWLVLVEKLTICMFCWRLQKLGKKPLDPLNSIPIS
jgi:hypothetical protein